MMQHLLLSSKYVTGCVTRQQGKLILMSLHVFSGWHNWVLVETGVLFHCINLQDCDWFKVSGINGLTLVHGLWEIHNLETTGSDSFPNSREPSVQIMANENSRAFRLMEIRPLGISSKTVKQEVPKPLKY